MSDQTGKKGKKEIDGFSWLAYILVASGLFSLDQFVKSIVSLHFLPGSSLRVIKDIFHITLVENTGIAFGLLRNRINLSFAFFILGILIFSSLLFRERDYSRQGRTALSLIIGGALSNLVDRIRLGYVIDYLDFRIWPVFNLADTAITIGIGLLCWELFRRKSEIRNSQSEI